MPIINRAAELQEEVAGWRRHLHTIPEILYDLPKTAAYVEERLKEIGVDTIETGVGKVGLVATVKGNLGDGPTIGLRTDMDALPITETSGVEWVSEHPGNMHACGHDGHMAMLLGAAKYLSETRNFAGTVVFIFQPAEEGGAGAMAMIEDGMIDKYNIDRVYGMHNHPGTPVGEFSLREGAFFAAADHFTMKVIGRGGHASQPHLTVDPVFISAQIIVALQGLVARQTDPMNALVLSITTMHGGTAHNIIPSEVELMGTVRSLNQGDRDLAEGRIKATASAIAESFGGKIELEYFYGYPATVNHAAQTELAASAAMKVAGETKVDTKAPPLMAAEDFSYMLEARPGAFINIGNGDSAVLHHSDYDFDDEAIPYGISYWATLTETELAPKS